MLALKFVSDCFVTSKMIEKFDNVVFSNNVIVFGDIVSDTVRFFSNNIGLNSKNLNNINLDEVNFNDHKIINHVRFYMAWCK